MTAVSVGAGIATTLAHFLPDDAPAPVQNAKAQQQYFATDGLSQKNPDLPGPLTGLGIQENAQQSFAGSKYDYTKGSLFFRKNSQGLNYTDPQGNFAAIDFDLILEEEVTLSAKVAQHPVQSGDPITDHIQPLPMTGRLKVLVSNYSLKYSPQGPFAAKWDLSVNRALAAYDAFKDLMQSRSAVTLVTVLETYSVNSVVITRVTVPKTHEDGDSLTFSIDYTQIRTIAKLDTTAITVSAKPRDMASPQNRAAAPKKSKGNASPTTVDLPASGVIPSGQ